MSLLSRLFGGGKPAASAPVEAYKDMLIHCKKAGLIGYQRALKWMWMARFASTA